MKSYDILKDHPINNKRRAAGQNPATSSWFWGEVNKPALDSFEKLYGLKGSVVAEVDLVKGLGISAGLKSVEVLEPLEPSKPTLPVKPGRLWMN